MNEYLDIYEKLGLPIVVAVGLAYGCYKLIMFLWSALAHLIALTSPGPDTAIVLRQVSLHGRVEGIKAAIGIGLGIYVHCLLAINGISLIILSNDLYKLIISLIGGAYIFYLGMTMLVSNSQVSTEINNKSTVSREKPVWK